VKNIENQMIVNIRWVDKWVDCWECGGLGNVEEKDGDGCGGRVTCPECLGERGRYEKRMV
jgi:hypothetical protein